MSAPADNRLFGSVERRLFRATAVLLALVALTALVVGILWTLGIVLSFFYNLIMPLCVAGILALVLYPVVNYLERSAWLNRLAATSIVVLTFIAAIAGFVIMVVPALIRETVLFAEMVPGILARWEEFMMDTFPGFTRMLMRTAEGGEVKEALPGLERTGATVKSFAGALVGLSFVPLLLFFGLLSGGRLHDHITGMLSVFSTKTQKKTMYFIDVFLAQVTGFFQGQLVIAVIMGVMFAIGFSLIGMKGGILIGLLLGLLNIVPFLGTLIGLLVVLPWSYMQPGGSFQLLGLSLVVFTVVQLVESWALTPKIMADRSGLHPALVIVSVFFWGTAFGGITGMILAVPLTAFLIAAWSQAKPGLTQSLQSDHETSRIETPTGSAQEKASRDSLNSP